jgi:hypothetical protein
MAPKPNRSPVLGYNHNLKYRGRIFHIQSEDSGPQNPRLFTHLYFGGTILASKKHEYDPAAAEDVVRGLMQSQHKSILKELKAGKHDERIVRFFAGRGETLDAVSLAIAADPQTLDLDAAPEIQVRADGSPSSSLTMPLVTAAAPAAAPALTASSSFADTFEDEPTTPDQAEQVAARQRLATERATQPSLPAVDRTIEMELPTPPSEEADPARAASASAAARRRLTRTPALGAPVLIERAIGVGQQISAGARALFRGRKPAPSIPYVVKEGSHPLADQQLEPPAPSSLPPAVALNPPPTTATNAPLTSGSPVRFPPPAPPAEKSLDEVILAYLAQGGDDR